MTDSLLRVAQEREHQLALDLAQSLVRIDALKFELARALEKASDLEAKDANGNKIIETYRKLHVEAYQKIHKLRGALEELIACKDAAGPSAFPGPGFRWHDAWLAASTTLEEIP